MASYFTKFNQLTKQSPNQPFKQAGKLLTQQAAVPFPSPRTLNIDSKKMCNFEQAAFKYIARVQMNEDFIYIVHFQCTLNMKARELETRSPKKCSPKIYHWLTAQRSETRGICLYLFIRNNKGIIVFVRHLLKHLSWRVADFGVKRSRQISPIFPSLGTCG